MARHILADYLSLGMFPIEDLVFIRTKKVFRSDIPKDVISAIRHRNISAILTKELGFQVDCIHRQLQLLPTDTLYIAQYTESSEHAGMEFYEITFANAITELI